MPNLPWATDSSSIQTRASTSPQRTAPNVHHFHGHDPLFRDVGEASSTPIRAQQQPQFSIHQRLAGQIQRVTLSHQGGVSQVLNEFLLTANQPEPVASKCMVVFVVATPSVGTNE